MLRRRIKPYHVAKSSGSRYNFISKSYLHSCDNFCICCFKLFSKSVSYNGTKVPDPKALYRILPPFFLNNIRCFLSVIKVIPFLQMKTGEIYSSSHYAHTPCSVTLLLCNQQCHAGWGTSAMEISPNLAPVILFQSFKR